MTDAEPPPDVPSAPPGRGREMAHLLSALGQAGAGKGSCIVISGEPGIGKTKLVDDFCAIAKSRGAEVRRGSARRDSPRPYQAFADAIGPDAASAIFGAESQRSFSALLLLDSEGRQLATASAEDSSHAIQPDTLARTLDAVQGFVKDSFGAEGGLGQLEYGSTTVMVARRGDRVLAGIVDGPPSAEMRPALEQAATEVSGGDAVGVMGTLLARRFTARRSTEGVKLEAERARMAGMLLDEMARISERATLAFVVEDIHWADGPALHAAEYVARNAGRIRLLLVLTMRAGESKSADDASAAIMAVPGSSEIPLRRLDSEAIGEIIASQFSFNAFPKGFSEKLAGDCAGNPLFAVELLRHMEETGAIIERGGAYLLSGDAVSTPASLSELVERRLSSLEPEAMSMAEFCSCIGREFRRDFAMGRPSSPDPSSELGRLLSSGIVTARGKECEFTHALFQEVTYGRLSMRWKTANHRALGELYESLDCDGHGRFVFELARHFHLGAHPKKALGYCLAAGEKAESSFAAEQGLELYAWAIEDAAKALQGDGLRTTVSDLHERRGDLLLLKGEYTKAEAELASSLACCDGRNRSRLIRKQALALERQSRFDDALALIPEARKSASGDRVDEGKTLATESFLLARKGEYAKAAAAARDASSMLEGSADPDAIAKLVRCHNVVAIDHRRMGRYDESIRSSQTALELGIKSGDLRSESVSYSHLGNVYWLKGENEKALEYHSKDLAIAQRRKDPYDTALALANIGNVYLKRKDYPSALDHYQRALEIRERIGDRLGVATLQNNIGVVKFENGDVEGSAACYSQALAVSEAIGDRQNIGNAMYNLGEAEMMLGRFDRAREVLSSVRAKSLEWGLATRASSVIVMMAENERRAGEISKARELALEAEAEAVRQGFAKQAEEARAVIAKIGSSLV